MNLQSNRHGFHFDHVVSREGSKSKIVRLEVFYLKTFSGNKGVRVRIAPMGIEQCEGYTMESFVIADEGTIGVWAKMLARKSDKEVLAVAMALDPVVPDLINIYNAEGPAKAKDYLTIAMGERITA